MTEKRSPGYLYIFLPLIGGIILLLNRIVLHTGQPAPGEYYYSTLLRINYSYLSGSLFFLSGVGAGYYFKVNPWITAFALIAIFPLTAIYEATVYKGSHNLIPFEFVIFFFYSLPAVAGTYVGRFLYKERNKS